MVSTTFKAKGCDMEKLGPILIVDNEDYQLEMIEDMVSYLGYSAKVTDSPH